MKTKPLRVLTDLGTSHVLASTREKKENTVTHAVVQNAAGGETEFAWRFHPGIRRSLSPRLFEAQEQNARLHVVFC
jgi:hypothetical protein